MYTYWSLVILGLPAFLPAVEPVPEGQVARVTALVRPAAREEKWTTIPWHTSLWEARTQAAREGKPILLWEMDGHPLGCV